MKVALISIKPIYANEIRKNKKKWEFRKYQIKEYNQIYIYEPYPIQKITMKIYISDYIQDTPQKIWKQCKNEAGIKRKEFMEYFKNKKKAYAYRIERYEEANIDIIKNNITPPQAISYIEEDSLL